MSWKQQRGEQREPSRLNEVSLDRSEDLGGTCESIGVRIEGNVSGLKNFQQIQKEQEGVGPTVTADPESPLSHSHTQTPSHSLFLLVHFHQKHLKVGLKFKKFEICEERIAELFSFLAEMQQFVHQSSTRSEEKQTETLCLIPSKQFV